MPVSLRLLRYRTNRLISRLRSVRSMNCLPLPILLLHSRETNCDYLPKSLTFSVLYPWLCRHIIHSCVYIRIWWEKMKLIWRKKTMNVANFIMLWCKIAANPNISLGTGTSRTCDILGGRQEYRPHCKSVCMAVVPNYLSKEIVNGKRRVML